jgi:hypothetical protein
MPILVHEFVPVPVEDPAPVLFNRRAKIWRQAMPPDQLNPAGHIDGDLAAFMPTQVRAPGLGAGPHVLPYVRCRGKAHGVRACLRACVQACVRGVTRRRRECGCKVWSKGLESARLCALPVHGGSPAQGRTMGRLT